MKRGFLAVLVAGLTVAMLPSVDAEAKRLGGARSTGAQRQTPTQPVQKAPAQPDGPAGAAAGAAPGAAGSTTAAGAAGPATAAAVGTTAAAAGAAKAAGPATQAARRSWTGPLMGLAAGLGLAALFSSLGMGEGFSSVMMILLLAMVGFFLFRFIMSRFGGRGRAGSLTPAAAGAGAGSGLGADFGAKESAGAFGTTTERRSDQPLSTQGIRIGSALTPPVAVPGTTTSLDAAPRQQLPADFDSRAFERIAKTIFIRLQAANDERNLDDLRSFSTPEMFAELKTDLMERGERTQHTEVLSVNPTIVDFADESQQRVVSVRYVGVIREEDAAGGAESFDETWHLVQTPDSAAWRIAGIQQNS